MPGNQKPDIETAIHRLGQLLGVFWLVLAVSGVYLIFRYRPTASVAYNDMETLRSDVTFGLWIRRIHNLVSIPALLIPVVLGYLHARQNRPRPAFAAAAAVCLTIGLWYTGKLLPWDQLALWAVTVGTNLRGFVPIFDDDTVRFVLIDGTEISTSTIQTWFFLHTLALPALLLLIAGGYWYMVSRRKEAIAPSPAQ